MFVSEKLKFQFRFAKFAALPRSEKKCYAIFCRTSQCKNCDKNRLCDWREVGFMRRCRIWENSDFELFGCARVNTESNAVHIAEMLLYDDERMIKENE